VKNYWQTYTKLAQQQRNWLWRAGWVVLVIKVLLILLPYSFFRKHYDRLVSVRLSKQYDDQTLQEVAWAIRVVSSRWPWNAVCLPQALSFKYLLREDSMLLLQIGVNRNKGGEFQAHAWVEKDGKILIGDTAEEYQTLWTWN